jgi:putative ABC transport system permease protein
MVPLARKTLLYEWRRFLPATLAVAFAGLLLLLQVALVIGIFESASVCIRESDGDLWVGYPGTQTMDLGRPVPSDTEVRLLTDPDVTRVEPYLWVDGDWRGPTDRGGMSVYVSGIDPEEHAMALARVLPAALRARLYEPDAVILDAADLNKLGVGLGDTAAINGHPVRVVGVTRGLRALGGVNVVASLETARRVDEDPTMDGRSSYYLVALRDPTCAGAVEARHEADSGRYAVWTRAAFARRAELYWLLDTGAGVGVLFLAIVVVLVGAVITSQTLMGAVASSTREYATLLALGIGSRDLYRVVLEQASWIGLGGLAVAGALALAALGIADRLDVPARIPTVAGASCAILVIGISLVSGVIALRALRRMDPGVLMR